MEKKLFFNRKNIAYDMQDLIVHMLENDVNKSYTIDEVVSHPWFKKCKNKIKNIDSITINKNNKNNFDEFETNVTKVTKVMKDPKENWPTSRSLLHKTKSFSFETSNYSNFDKAIKNNFYSNKSIKFKNLKNIDINYDENLIDNNDEEDGFSPFMKNGSINISVSLKKYYYPNTNLNYNYSFKNEITNSKTQSNPDLNRNINSYPMDNSPKAILKGKIKQISKSYMVNPNRISIVKLNNKNNDDTPINSNFKNNQMKSNFLYNENNINNNNIINYNFYQINNNNQFSNIFY